MKWSKPYPDCESSESDPRNLRCNKTTARCHACAYRYAGSPHETSKRLTLALRNVRALAKRLHRTDPENAAHLLRFCDEAGVKDNIMREGEP
jgi:hypothetical protein